MRHQLHRVAFFAAVLIALASLVSPPAARADSLFTSASTFDAATTGLTTITFTATGPTGVTDFSPAYTDSHTGTVFSLPTGQFLNVTGKDYYSPTDFSEDFLVTAFLSTGPETITFTSGVTAVGLDLGSFTGDPLKITLSDGSSFTVDPPASLGLLSFDGFTTTTPITSVTIATTVTDDAILVGDAVFGRSISTPEPTELSLLALGMAFLFGAAVLRETLARS